MSDLRRFATLISFALLLITSAPIGWEFIMQNGNDASIGMKILAFLLIIPVGLLSFMAALYFALFYPAGDWSTVPASTATPHALFWGAVFLGFIVYRIYNKSDWFLIGYETKQIMRKFSGSFGTAIGFLGSIFRHAQNLLNRTTDDTCLPRSPEARRKEIQRQKVAKELEDTLAEIKIQKARIKETKENQ